MVLVLKLIRLLLLVLPLAAAAQSKLPPCPADINAHRHNCFGTITGSGNKYVGEWKDDDWHGQGTLTFANGDKYVGEFKDGQFNGQGTYTSSNGLVYAGTFEDNYLVQGTYTEPKGNKYVGAFKENKFNGQGTYISSDGQKYVGQFKDDLFDGEGILYSPLGEITKIGRFENGRWVATSLQLIHLSGEVREARRQQEHLQQQLAAAQNQSSPMPPSAIMASPRNAHALVIGNAAYPGSMRLANPVNDANAISQKLRSLGFTVTTVTDMNRQRLVQAMTQFRKSAASADLSLLFYSGHGVQIFGTNYILPTDVDQSDVAQATIQGVRLNDVVENFMPGKTKLVFLDACRDNPLMRTSDRGVSLGLAPVSVAQGTLISYATKDGQTASDGVGSRNSPFTTALLEHLGDPNDIAVVLRKVREKVMQATGGRQQPWEYGSLTGGELVLSAVRGAGR